MAIQTHGHSTAAIHHAGTRIQAGLQQARLRRHCSRHSTTRTSNWQPACGMIVPDSQIWCPSVNSLRFRRFSVNSPTCFFGSLLLLHYKRSLLLITTVDTVSTRSQKESSRVFQVKGPRVARFLWVVGLGFMHYG